MRRHSAPSILALNLGSNEDADRPPTTKRRTLRALACLAIAVASLPGCSRSGAASGSGSGLRVEGQFIDSPVKGLHYSTSSGDGETGAGGSFSYRPGEKITFSVGATVIGETVPAKATMTLLDLVPGATLPTTKPQMNRLLAKYHDSVVIDPVIAPQMRLLNVLSFLHSIDEDKDPAKGIVISPGLAKLFAAEAIDLDRPSGKFEDDRSFRRLLYSASNEGFIVSARRVPPLLALERFAATLGIESKLYVTTTLSVDYTGDGVIELTRSAPIDSRGFVISVSYDSDQDGTPDSTVSNFYDDFGSTLGYSSDSNQDGKVDSTSSLQYDIHGNLLREERDNDADGKADNIYAYAYDANGNETRREEDYDGDGKLEKSCNYDYDSDGNLTDWDCDYDNDGKPDATFHAEYDEQGNQTLAIQDENNDGITDDYEATSYNSRGQITRHEVDADSDGFPDEIEEFEYDADGLLVGEQHDFDGEGQLQDVYTFTYDAHGKLTLRTFDEDGDGVIGQIDSFEYDADGNVVHTQTDVPGSGVRYVVELRYDSLGGLASVTSDSDGNGVVERNDTWTYDVDGRLLRYDAFVGGVPQYAEITTQSSVGYFGYRP